MLGFDTQNTAGRYICFFYWHSYECDQKAIEILREKAARVAYSSRHLIIITHKQGKDKVKLFMYMSVYVCARNMHTLM